MIASILAIGVSGGVIHVPDCMTVGLAEERQEAWRYEFVARDRDGCELRSRDGSTVFKLSHGSSIKADFSTTSEQVEVLEHRGTVLVSRGKESEAVWLPDEYAAATSSAHDWGVWAPDGEVVVWSGGVYNVDTPSAPRSSMEYLNRRKSGIPSAVYPPGDGVTWTEFRDGPFLDDDTVVRYEISPSEFDLNHKGSDVIEDVRYSGIVVEPICEGRMLVEISSADAELFFFGETECNAAIEVRPRGSFFLGGPGAVSPLVLRAWRIDSEGVPVARGDELVLPPLYAKGGDFVKVTPTWGTIVSYESLEILHPDYECTSPKQSQVGYSDHVKSTVRCRHGSGSATVEFDSYVMFPEIVVPRAEKRTRKPDRKRPWATPDEEILYGLDVDAKGGVTLPIVFTDRRYRHALGLPSLEFESGPNVLVRSYSPQSDACHANTKEDGEIGRVCVRFEVLDRDRVVDREAGGAFWAGPGEVKLGTREGRSEMTLVFERAGRRGASRVRGEFELRPLLLGGPVGDVDRLESAWTMSKGRARDVHYGFGWRSALMAAPAARSRDLMVGIEGAGRYHRASFTQQVAGGADLHRDGWMLLTSFGGTLRYSHLVRDSQWRLGLSASVRGGFVNTFLSESSELAQPTGIDGVVEAEAGVLAFLGRGFVHTGVQYSNAPRAPMNMMHWFLGVGMSLGSPTLD